MVESYSYFDLGILISFISAGFYKSLITKRKEQMKSTFKFKKLLVSLAIASSASLTIAPATTQAGVTANAGIASKYVFRGIEQKGSASASAGLDYEADSGLYVGTWVGDVETGLEYDFYAGWAGEFNGVSLGLGGTYYGYTERDFDSPYKEVNLSLGYAGFTVGYDKGVWESDEDVDYTHAYLSYEYDAFSATYAVLDGDIDTKDDAISYLDLGYSVELAEGLDGSINYIYSMPEDSDVDPEPYLIFGISKAFNLM